MGGLAASLAQDKTAAHVNRRAALQIRQRKVDSAVAAVTVPNSEKSAWFWLIGRIWPLQNAQPLGGKLKETILISDR